MTALLPGVRRGRRWETEAPLPGRFHYGWLVVAALALTVTASYGVLLYAFPVLLSAMQGELGWSRQMLTGAYSLGILVGGVAAIPVGWWLDRHGSRLLMTVSAIGASILVAAWAQVSTPAAFYLIWVGLGVCSAGLFYEPAFTTIAQWFRRQRGSAFTIVTVAGGLASTIFVPLTAAMMDRFGWRTAVLSLAGVLATLTILPHALVLRRRRAILRPPRQPGPEISAFVLGLLRMKSLRWLTLAFFLSSVANMAFAVHLIPLLLERGQPIASASVALASVGVMKLVGRVLLVPMVRWTTVSTATATAFAFQAAGVALLAVFNSLPAVWTGVALFGMGDGASTPARAGLVAEFYGSSRYGTISGVMALFLSIARASGPVGASLVLAATGGYDAPLLVMTGLLLLAVWALKSAGVPSRGHTQPT